MQAPGQNLGVQRTQQGHVYSRRALLYGHTESYGAIQAVSGQEAPAGDGVPAAGSSFDANVVMILAVLLCALICALGLNSIVRCALRCSSSSPAAAGSRELGSVARLAQAGVRRKALRAMPTLVYSAGQALGPSPACAICLADLEPGERVRVLPKCNHGFHVRCVDRWLMARSTCPTCRQPLFGEPHKASGCAETTGHQDDNAGAGAAPVRSFFVPLPLPPEGCLVSPKSRCPWEDGSSSSRAFPLDKSFGKWRLWTSSTPRGRWDWVDHRRSPPLLLLHPAAARRRFKAAPATGSRRKQHLRIGRAAAGGA